MRRWLSALVVISIGVVTLPDGAAAPPLPSGAGSIATSDADSGPKGAPAAPSAVVRVGSVLVDRGRFVRRISAMPALQRRAFGGAASEGLRAFVARVVVPEALQLAEAQRRGLAGRPRFVAERRELLRSALLEELRDEVHREHPVTAAEAKRYFEAHRADFEQPLRLRLWRIVVDSEGLARKIIAEAAGVRGDQRWRALAREHSLDAATKLRGGDLGFVDPEGRSEQPRVRVDAACYRAALGVADGELVPEPLTSGAQFVVLWRRGSRPAASIPFQEVSDAIRERLLFERVSLARDALLKGLRGQHLSEYRPEATSALPPSATGRARDSGQP